MGKFINHTFILKKEAKVDNDIYKAYKIIV